MDWHSISSDEVLEKLKVNPQKGLSFNEVKERRKQYGKNELPESSKVSLVKIFLHQFKSPLIYLLFFAAIAAFIMKEYSDGMVILFVVTLNSIIGLFQEARAEKSMEDLRKVTTYSVRVLRDGEEATLKAVELVPGDIVLFNAGDAISADCRLISGPSLEVSESVLTGESVPVKKKSEQLAHDLSLGDRVNMLYSGTFATAGRALAVVVATGGKTEIGKIAELTGNVVEPPTPLNQRIADFSRYLIYASGIIFVLIIGIGWLQGIGLTEIVMVAISQVVSLVPEGLPVAITVAASVGVQRMARKKTIVRKISAVETLGSTSVICSDKTGTLTLNQMTVTEVKPWPHQTSEIVERLFLMATLCNDAQLSEGKDLGDPTESSLLRAAAERGINKVESDKNYKRVKEIPFDSSVKMMATQHTDKNGDGFVALKGASESILDLCQMEKTEREEILALTEEMAARALRVLGVAWIPKGEITHSFDDFKGEAIFLGLLGQIDPPREEVKKAIEDCRRAGIRPVMITGDHKSTGLAIANMIGLAQKSDRAMEGREIQKTLENIQDIAVFARVHPSQKLYLVDAFQKAGHVVAMTGDGVNDAPALGKADVGVAMGITGTEVAKEASKIIITDDNFTTIVSAIAEGRLVYQNIKKVILLFFSTSVAEVCVLLFALIAGYASPYAAVQILWNNLVTEGVITVNLIMEPPEGNEMDRPPIPKNEPLLTKIMFTRMLLIVPAIVLCTFGWYVWRIGHGVELLRARTETLTMLVVCQWFNVLNCRSETKTALSLSILKNKWLLGGLVVGNVLHILVVYWRPLGQYFHTVPIDFEIIPCIAVIGSLVLWVEEARKLYVRRMIRRKV